MSKKEEFARQAASVATLFAQAIEAGERLRLVYFARGYQPKGGDEMTEADAAAAGLDISTLSGIVAAAENISKFVTGGAAVAAAWGETFHKGRLDV